MIRLHNSSDVTVFLYAAFGLICSPHDNIYHRVSQIICPDDLVGKQHPKHRIDATQDAVAEIRFFARLYWIDISRPEDVEARKSRREQRLLNLSLVAGESQPASSRRVRATATQKRRDRSRAGGTENPCELDGVVDSDLAELRIRH